MSVAFTLYLMCKVLFYEDCMMLQVCMYVYSGACRPRVGSQQASQNKLIWFTLLCYLLCSGDKITQGLWITE